MFLYGPDFHRYPGEHGKHWILCIPELHWIDLHQYPREYDKHRTFCFRRMHGIME